MTGITAVGHRGAPYVARENTLPSFGAAIAAGADAVEVDVRLTRDGVPVVVHDRTLERLWERTEEVSAVTADRLRELTVGGVPTLAEALEATAPVRTLVDLPDPGAVPAAVRAVGDAGAADRVYYCGGPLAMRAVRATDPAAEIALTWHRTAPPRPSLLADVRPRWLNFRFGLLTPELVGRAKADGYRVSAWTPDTGRNMRRLLAMGVESVTTNRMDALCRVLRRTGRPAPVR
ncbi:glycerophosphodiester phosphodiesterase [Streptomyces armeniacus]|uniref:Glycerophosphodiester phosphodiesterase n=2 Tax=Streptomyces armeniacus TaxID=83291 RepID=A0A345Y056_9ACTN|nr:glycerophosphodiester phosphodiesterase [Streptomyces armeniacus]AXK37272.1 glycerophosphodiester phosphodiesterase [Streptomyces armeniacus]